MTRRLRLPVAFLLLAVLAAPAALAAADQAGAGGGGLTPAEAKRLTFLFWGYTAFWLILAVYIVSMAVRLRSVQREITRLRERLGGGPDGGS